MGSRNEIRAEKEWEDMNYTYILKCSDETLYTGWTNDLEKRINAHNAGKGAKYTKNRRPVELAYYEEFATKKEAMSREYAIKQLTRRKKEELIKKGHPGIQFGT
jgi:putative endonuclease